MKTAKEHFLFTILEWSKLPFTKILEELPNELDVIVDIGANAGGWSYIMKQKYPKSVVYALEPVTESYNELLMVEDINAIKKGIYYGADKAKIKYFADNIGSATLDLVQDEYNKQDYGEEVYLTTLEKVVFKADLIKLDVEGAEKNIIENSTLLKKTKHLIIEWHYPQEKAEIFFANYLPNHKIKVNLQDIQYYLTL